MMYFADRCNHAIPFFIDANALPITFLYCESISNLVHDINNNNAPLNIVHFFERTSSIHSYYTRLSTSGMFSVKSFRLAIEKHSFCRLGVKLWNEIPSHITDLPKKTFTMVLRQLLFDVLEKEDDYIEIPMIIKNVGLTK